MILVDTVQRSHVYHVSYSRARGGRQAQEGRVDQSAQGQANATPAAPRGRASHEVQVGTEYYNFYSVASRIERTS